MRWLWVALVLVSFALIGLAVCSVLVWRQTSAFAREMGQVLDRWTQACAALRAALEPLERRS